MNLTSVKINKMDLPFVKDYLKVDYEDEDTFITSLIVSSQSFIEAQLGYKITDRFENEDDIPGELTVAALMLISHWFENRNLPMKKISSSDGEMGYAVSAIIDAHADHMKEGD